MPRNTGPNILYYPLKTYTIFEGHRYELDLAFDTVLRMFDFQKDSMFTVVEHIEITINMLVRWRSRWWWIFKPMSFNKKCQLYQQISQEFLVVKERLSQHKQRAFDFHQDASLIYSSFWQAYHIDLQLTRLDWRVFLSLFRGLPANTKIREIMELRTREVPPLDKQNAKQIHKLREAQQFWALDIDPEEAQKSFQEGVNQLASTLVRWAAAPERKPSGVSKNRMSDLQATTISSGTTGTHQGEVPSNVVQSIDRSDNKE